MARGGEMVTAPFTPVESAATHGVKMSGLLESLPYIAAGLVTATAGAFTTNCLDTTRTVAGVLVKCGLFHSTVNTSSPLNGKQN